ncbi:MAG: hypothetical protein J6U54_10805 [Clostridiales bacterium]|nr:hypothetical protein [Clostridiales bacterium]
MRSEERSGIIAVVLILLWGTLATEPFRYFAGIVSDGIMYLLSKVSVKSGGKISVLVVSIVLVFLSVALLKLSSGEIGKYIAPIGGSLALLVFLIRCLITRTVDVKVTVALMASVVIFLILLLLKTERILVWLSDAFILSMGAYLVSSWLFVPISKISAKTGKFFFPAFRSTADFAAPFKGIISVPKIIWGIFFTILFMLPIIYFVPGRRKA